MLSGRRMSGWCGSLILGLFVPNLALSVTLDNTFANYSDNTGLKANHVGLGLTLGDDSEDDGLHPANPITANSLTITGSRDFYDEGPDAELSEEKIEEQKELGNTIAPRNHETDTVALNGSVTINKYTELSANGSYTRDQALKNNSHSYGAGISQWMFSETVRLGISGTRTVSRSSGNNISQDYDLSAVDVPENLTSNQFSASIRHLATRTTVIDYSAGGTKSDNRPYSENYALNIRQFIPWFGGAIHGGIARAVNKGKLKNDTTLGQLDAWQYDIAYLQSLWSGANGKISYRQYRENETTRIDQNEKVFGSDLVGLNLSQEIDDVFYYPLILDLAGYHYRSNKDNRSLDLKADEKVFANIFEVGLSTKI